MTHETTGNTRGMTTGYVEIAAALAQHEKSFFILQKEMEEFKPRPEESYNKALIQETQRLQDLNPDKSRTEIEKLVDITMRPGFTPENQFGGLFHMRIRAELVQVVMLSHSLCEALGNAILAVGLTENNSQELFGLIERASLREKWTLGPRLFEPTYRFPKGEELDETLSSICKVRNGFVHHKSAIHHDGKTILRGTKEEFMSHEKTADHIRRYLKLPYNLLDNCIEQFPYNMAFNIPHQSVEEYLSPS